MPIVDSETTIGLDGTGLPRCISVRQPETRSISCVQYLQRKWGPIMPRAWESATMPPSVRETLASLDLMRPEGVAEVEADSTMFSGFRNYVLARTDASVATMHNGQSGLFRATV